jgi:hypothetical protein
MKKKLNWLVFERGDIIACFVSFNDATEFVSQCGSASMKTSAASATVAKELVQYCPLTNRQNRRLRLSGAEAKQP